MTNSNETYKQSEFLSAYEKATPVEFQKDWKNSTGYLDGSAYAVFLQLEPGATFSFTDDFNRRAVGIVVQSGHNLVVFERYSPEENGTKRSNVLVSNTTPELKHVLNWVDGSVSADDVSYVGPFEYNNAFGKYKRVKRAIAAMVGA